MRKIAFKGKVNFMAYHSHEADFVDGEIKEVPDDVAEYLLGDFPEHFTEVGTKEMKRPVKDRMLRGATTRRMK